MSAALWTEGDTSRALRFWAEYQSCHEIADRLGQTVGIAPSDGRIWFGSDALDVVRKRDADGVTEPLYIVRVGRDYYLRKGGRR
jgi:hypothetical protein